MLIEEAEHNIPTTTIDTKCRGSFYRDHSLGKRFLHRCDYINETLTTTPPRTDGRRDRGMLMEELNKLYQANKILLLEYTAVLQL